MSSARSVSPSRVLFALMMGYDLSSSVLRTVLKSYADVQHRLVRAELHFVNIKLKSLGHVTIPRIRPNLLSPARHGNEGKEEC